MDFNAFEMKFALRRRLNATVYLPLIEVCSGLL